MTIRTLPLAILLAGCASLDLPHGEPQPSPMVLSNATMPEISTVSVPMPALQAVPTPAGSARASLYEARSPSLFADNRADQVGDIVTVVISIDDEARLRNASDRERGGSAQAGFPTFFGLGTLIARVLPGVDPQDLPLGKDVVEVGAQASVSGSGTINRNEEINLKVAALVVQRLPNGNLVIAGRQDIKVNHEMRELRMAGIVRPSDIRNDNTIPYERIAEARIAYGGQGTLSRAQERGYGERAMDIMLPY